VTGLSRCGKRYTSWDDALKAAEARTFKSGRPWHITGCPVRGMGEHWHITEHRAASRPDPFPPAVARLLDARDEHCQRCGATGRLERHHRRAKASGGSGARAHTQCACNGVRLCRGCHRAVHEHPAQSRDHGWIVSQSVALPGKVAMTPWNAWRSVLWYPTCEGGWTDGQENGVRL